MKNQLQKIIGNLSDKLRKLYVNTKIIENSKQYLLLSKFFTENSRQVPLNREVFVLRSNG